MRCHSPTPQPMPQTHKGSERHTKGEVTRAGYDRNVSLVLYHRVGAVCIPLRLAASQNAPVSLGILTMKSTERCASSDRIPASIFDGFARVAQMLSGLDLLVRSVSWSGESEELNGLFCLKLLGPTVLCCMVDSRFVIKSSVLIYGCAKMLFIFKRHLVLYALQRRPSAWGFQ
jgi:hypothetical protein